MHILFYLDVVNTYVFTTCPYVFFQKNNFKISHLHCLEMTFPYMLPKLNFEFSFFRIYCLEYLLANIWAMVSSNIELLIMSKIKRVVILLILSMKTT